MFRLFKIRKEVIRLLDDVAYRNFIQKPEQFKCPIMRNLAILTRWKPKDTQMVFPIPFNAFAH